jgi:hypothetical protein
MALILWLYAYLPSLVEIVCSHGLTEIELTCMEKAWIKFTWCAGVTTVAVLLLAVSPKYDTVQHTVSCSTVARSDGADNTAQVAACPFWAFPVKLSSSNCLFLCHTLLNVLLKPLCTNAWISSATFHGQSCAKCTAHCFLVTTNYCIIFTSI